mmetsp:Transcript_10237/g.19359  ORF Transcript_10237/g.19359 Transcript_10237/m.19359 type:complete len:376 (+) Transcript_10237:36-1163(+)|eukprot:CAMPEP_0175120102 /NCGR_PEP_ID=MMETSP0087-20121206/434_1 /TAXON_ID=136419 /ORGANISM="Unknown Unknown, Strain D1" /LENGTH=375 /DNA_ID=CAMNT_0016401511 /DNA_START=36 /DNA_END=1163 /DNA_ORIENTATION=+
MDGARISYNGQAGVVVRTTPKHVVVRLDGGSDQISINTATCAKTLKLEHVDEPSVCDEKENTAAFSCAREERGSQKLKGHKVLLEQQMKIFGDMLLRIQLLTALETELPAGQDGDSSKCKALKQEIAELKGAIDLCRSIDGDEDNRLHVLKLEQMVRDAEESLRCQRHYEAAKQCKFHPFWILFSHPQISPHWGPNLQTVGSTMTSARIFFERVRKLLYKRKNKGSLGVLSLLVNVLYTAVAYSPHVVVQDDKSRAKDLYCEQERSRMAYYIIFIFNHVYGKAGNKWLNQEEDEKVFVKFFKKFFSKKDDAIKSDDFDSIFEDSDVDVWSNEEQVEGELQKVRDRFQRPPPCRFGKQCNKRPNCPFWHDDQSGDS